MNLRFKCNAEQHKFGGIEVACAERISCTQTAVRIDRNLTSRADSLLGSLQRACGLLLGCVLWKLWWVQPPNLSPRQRVRCSFLGQACLLVNRGRPRNTPTACQTTGLRTSPSDRGWGNFSSRSNDGRATAAKFAWTSQTWCFSIVPPTFFSCGLCVQALTSTACFSGQDLILNWRCCPRGPAPLPLGLLGAPANVNPR